MNHLNKNITADFFTPSRPLNFEAPDRPDNTPEAIKDPVDKTKSTPDKVDDAVRDEAKALQASAEKLMPSDHAKNVEAAGFDNVKFNGKSGTKEKFNAVLDGVDFKVTVNIQEASNSDSVKITVTLLPSDSNTGAPNGFYVAGALRPEEYSGQVQHQLKRGITQYKEEKAAR